jgi:uncharacterized membrane protein YgaE (UPF0421/DUF939 family)
MQIRWRMADWKNALLTASAACVCHWLTGAIGLQTGYWAVITAILICQSEVGASLIASRDRLLGTVVGAVSGGVALATWHERAWVFGIALLLTTAICNILDLQPAGRLAGVTLAVIVLIPRPGTAWHIAWSRFVEVSIGVVVALVLTAIFYPRSLRDAGVKIGVGD